MNDQGINLMKASERPGMASDKTERASEGFERASRELGGPQRELRGPWGCGGDKRITNRALPHICGYHRGPEAQVVMGPRSTMHGSA